MVRLLRKLRTNKSQAKNTKNPGRKSRDEGPHAAPETGGPRNFYKEEESRKTEEHAGDANVTLMSPPPD